MNYWDQPYKTLIVPISVLSMTANKTQKYVLENIDADFKADDLELVGVSHRVPNANAITLDGKELVGSDIFHAAFLHLRDRKDRPILDLPLSTIAERSGGDNYFLQLPRGVLFDLENKKSFLTNKASDANTNAAATNSEQFELVFWYRLKEVC